MLLARALRAAPAGGGAPAVHRAGGGAARRRAPVERVLLDAGRRLPARPGRGPGRRRPGGRRQPDQPDLGAAPRRRRSPRWPGPGGCWWSTRRSPTPPSPGEPESLAGRRDLPGLVVVRSLTKTWGLAGLRIGYLLGAADAAGPAGRRPAALAGLDARAGRRARPAPRPAAVAAERAIAAAARRRPRTWSRALARCRAYASPAARPAPFVLVHLPGADRVRLPCASAATRCAAATPSPAWAGPPARRGPTRPRRRGGWWAALAEVLG